MSKAKKANSKIIAQQVIDKLITKSSVSTIVEYAIEPIYDWWDGLDVEGKLNNKLVEQAYNNVNEEELKLCILKSNKFKELEVKIADAIAEYVFEEVNELGYALEDDKLYKLEKAQGKMLKSKIEKSLSKEQLMLVKQAVKQNVL